MYWIFFMILPWPVVNLFYLVKAIIREEDIGFVFYYRIFFSLHGPYDLVLSDFFSRLVSSIIVLVGIIISAAFTIWINLL